jgi:hypothetical protein
MAREAFGCGRLPGLNPGHAAGLELGDDLVGDFLVETRPVLAQAGTGGVFQHRGFSATGAASFSRDSQPVTDDPAGLSLFLAGRGHGRAMAADCRELHLVSRCERRKHAWRIRLFTCHVVVGWSASDSGLRPKWLMTLGEIDDPRPENEIHRLRSERQYVNCSELEIGSTLARFDRRARTRRGRAGQHRAPPPGLGRTSPHSRASSSESESRIGHLHPRASS